MAKKFFLDELQGELKRAFKWMATATESAQEGDFCGSAYAMTVSFQHWIKCQNIRDKYIDDSDAESMNWKYFTNKSLVLAKREIEKEHNQEIANDC